MKNLKCFEKKEKSLTRKTASPRAVTVPEIRDDGLTVFCDGDEMLDDIRRHGTKQQVITAVAMRRAQEIAFNYARKYAPELLSELTSSAKSSPLGLPCHLDGSAQ